MSDPSPAPGPNIESLVGQIAGQYFEELAEGGCPKVEEYAARHPEIADVLRETLPVLAALGMQASEKQSSKGDMASGVPKVLGEFRIVRELGRGGMGLVFEAEQLSVERRVALKVLPLAAMLDEQRLTRFKNEVRAAATLDHPNIVSIFSVGEDRGVQFFAMQLVHGQSLAKVIELLRDQHDILDAESISRAVADSMTAATETHAENGSFDASTKEIQSVTVTEETVAYKRTHRDKEFFRSVARIGRASAEALHHAHQRGVIHRDVKPGNLLVDSQGTVYVTDFGLARIEQDTRLTTSGNLLGTLRYMAPEQANGDSSTVDHRADVFSLGLSLYELTTLRPAYPGEMHAQVASLAARRPPKPIRQLAPDVPPELATIISKAIETNPTDRYASAQDLADDLGRFLQHKPIHARPPTLIDRAVKWSRRNSDLAWVSAGFLLLSVIGVVIAAFFMLQLYRSSEYHRVQADLQLHEAESARHDAELHRATLQEELYSLDMQAAFEAWDDGRVDIVRPILAKYIPNEDLPDVRTFAWYALEEYTEQPSPLVLAGHEGAVREVALHPDGKRIISAGDDGTIRSWDIARAELLSTIETQLGPLNGLAISPDGRMVATGENDLYLWDLETGQRTRRLTTFKTTIEEVLFSPDGKFVAAGPRNNAIRIIDLESGTVRDLEMKSGNEDMVNTYDGQGLLAGCKNKEGHDFARMWNWADGKMISQLTSPSDSGVRILARGPRDCGYAMAGLGVSDITFWDGELDRYQGKTVETMIDACDLAISADGRLIAGAGRDGRLRMFQVDPQRVAAPRKGIIPSTRLVLPAHDARITSITFTDVESVATASEDGLIKLWRFRRPAYRSQRIPTQRGHACFTDTLDGCLVFFRDGSLALWDALTESTQWRLGTEHDNVQMIEIAADGSHFVCVDDRHTARVWTTSTQELVATFDHPARIMTTTLSPDGRYLALTGVDGFTKVWDIQANRKAYVCNLDDWGLATQFSPDGTRLVLGGKFDEVILVKTDTWEVECRLSCRNSTQVVSFDESGNRLATAHNNRVHVWDLGTKQRIQALHVQEFEKIRSMAFHPDGETLAIGGNYPVVDLWHLPTERRLGTAMRFRDSDIAFARQLAFDPSGRSLRAVVYKERLGARYFTTLSTSYSPIESDGQHNSHR